MKEGDLVHEPPDWAEFPESASDNSSFYSNLRLCSAPRVRNILLGEQVWSHLSISILIPVATDIPILYT